MLTRLFAAQALDESLDGSKVRSALLALLLEGHSRDAGFRAGLGSNLERPFALAPQTIESASKRPSAAASSGSA